MLGGSPECTAFHDVGSVHIFLFFTVGKEYLPIRNGTVGEKDQPIKNGTVGEKEKDSNNLGRNK